MKKIFTIIVLLVTFMLMSMSIAYAAEGAQAAPRPIPCVPSLPCIATATQQSGTGTRAYILGTVGKNAMLTMMGISAMASVGFIIWGGVQMHISMGADEAIGKAKKTILWAIAGLVVSTLSAAIVTIVSQIPIK